MKRRYHDEKATQDNDDGLLAAKNGWTERRTASISLSDLQLVAARDEIWYGSGFTRILASYLNRESRIGAQTADDYRRSRGLEREAWRSMR